MKYLQTQWDSFGFCSCFSLANLTSAFPKPAWVLKTKHETNATTFPYLQSAVSACWQPLSHIQRYLHIHCFKNTLNSIRCAAPSLTDLMVQTLFLSLTYPVVIPFRPSRSTPLRVWTWAAVAPPPFSRTFD